MFENVKTKKITHYFILRTQNHLSDVKIQFFWRFSVCEKRLDRIWFLIIFRYYMKYEKKRTMVSSERVESRIRAKIN